MQCRKLSRELAEYCFESTVFPKDPAVLKILRDSELLRRSVFITPPQIYYAVNASSRRKMSAIPRKMVSAHDAPR